MSTLIYFQGGDDRRLDTGDIVECLESLPGMRLDGRTGDAYRQGEWRDEATGARFVCDVGEPPLEEDPMHPPTAYDGWRPIGLTVHLPLAGPHWQAVEVLRALEQVNPLLPGCLALDTEDTIANDGEAPGPFAWNRPRLLVSWERQRDQRVEGLATMPRMDRGDSVLMWRYRRERALAAAAHPGRTWAGIFALLDRETGAARSAVVCADPRVAMALPPVDLIAVAGGDAPGVIESEHLAGLAGAAGIAAARLPDAPAMVRALANAPRLAIARFAALDDADWRD